jgi:hypothetical protein
MTTTLMMKDIPIHPIYENEFNDCEEEYLYNEFCYLYDKSCMKDIYKYWLKSRSFHFLETDNICKSNYGYLRLKTYQLLKLIKDYAPDIYSTYEFSFEINKTRKQRFIIIHKLALKISADIINTRFNERFNNYIINKEAELSDADTDTE